MNETIRDTRAEGVYCHWETYPPDAMTVHQNILVIERVNGDQTVSRFECTRGEGLAIMSFLIYELNLLR